MTLRRGMISALCALGIAGASVTAAGPALAADAAVEAAIGFLEAQGYQIVEVERTWLGRIRIEAVRGGQERELVMNPRTGEVLRDYIEDNEDEQDNGEDGDGGGEDSSGSGGDDDDSDDDDGGGGGDSGSGGDDD